MKIVDSPAYLAFKHNKNHRSITLVCRLIKATFLFLSLAASRANLYSSQEVVHRWVMPFLFSKSTKTPSNLIKKDNTIQMPRRHVLVIEHSIRLKVTKQSFNLQLATWERVFEIKLYM